MLAVGMHKSKHQAMDVDNNQANNDEMGLPPKHCKMNNNSAGSNCPFNAGTAGSEALEDDLS